MLPTPLVLESLRLVRYEQGPSFLNRIEQNFWSMPERTCHFLDISGEVCPMTFVKTRLLIERMAPGEEAEIRLKGGEPLENVPGSVRELGHSILSVEREPDSPEPGIHRLRLRKNSRP